MRYLMTFSYDGSKFHGYQIQHGLRTVQEEIETELTRLNGMKKVKLIASGRTDALVHAYNQKGHFDFTKEMKPERVRNSLNRLLKGDIYIKSVEIVNDEFSARHDVLEKTYEYKINLGEYNPIEADYVYQYCKCLDVDKMKDGAEYLIGEHDFSSFVKKDSLKEDCVRNIYKIDFKKEKNLLLIDITGNGFMRYMVRNIVGTLIAVGEGKIEPSKIKEILDKKDRIYAKKTAPACGLYLKEVKY